MKCEENSFGIRIEQRGNDLMGYEHYWHRPLILDLAPFAMWSDDVRKVVETFPHGVICGLGGDGKPTFNPTLVTFDGNANTYIWVETWERYNGVSLRSGNQSDAHMPFIVEQSMLTSSRWWVRDRPDTFGLVHDACKTNGRAYDLAVTASLILLLHHFDEECKVFSDGETIDWQGGCDLAYRVTSNAFAVSVDEEGQVTIQR